MTTEKKAFVRIGAIGGNETKAQLRGVGDAGKVALGAIASGAPAASSGLEDVTRNANHVRDKLEEMAMRAAQATRSIQTTARATSDVMAGINRATGVTPAIGQTTAAYLRQGQALDELRAKFNPVYAAIRSYKMEVAELRNAQLQGAISADEMAAAISRARQASLANIAIAKGNTNAVLRMGRAYGAGAGTMRQMFFQLNDIGVSLAGGMNPLLVMAQQGTQIAQIYGFGNGGVAGALRDVQRMTIGIAAKFWPIAVAAGAVGAVIGGMTYEINKVADTTVSFGDVALATWQTIRDGIWQWIKPAVDAMAPWFSSAWDLIVIGAVGFGNNLIKAVLLAIEGIKFAAGAISDAFRTAFGTAKAWVFEALADMLSGVNDFVSSVVETLNETFRTDLQSPSGQVVEYLRTMAGRARDDAADTQGAGARWNTMRDNMTNIMGSDPLGAFFDQVRQNAQNNARDRQEEASATGAQASATERLTASLEQQLAVLRESDPIQRQMLEYSSQLAGATDAERARVEELVVELDRAKNGWEAVSRVFRDYAEDAGNIGKNIADVLKGAFSGAETAFKKFVTTGKFEFRSLAQSILADLSVMMAKQALFNALKSAGGGGGGFFSTIASLLHTGGMVGQGGTPRSVPLEMFAAAPRLHSGGMALRHDEVPTILQTGERVLNRAETREYNNGGRAGDVTFHIDARGAQEGVAEQIAQQLRAALPMIESKVIGKISSKSARGYPIGG